MSWGRRGGSQVRAVVIIAGALVLGAAFTGGAAATGAVAVLHAEIDGRPIAHSTATRPIILDARKDSTVDVEVDNNGTAPLVTHKVRVIGRSMGIPFFTYDYTLGTDIESAAGETTHIAVPFQLASLRGQVLGLLPGEVTLLDPAGRSVASEKFVMDARGSLRSIYGAVGIAVGAVTVLAFLSAIVGLARHRLSPNRLVRGLRFSVVGIGVGLTLVFSLSMLRVFLPQPARCARIVVVSALALLALGFLTPRPPMFEDEMPADADALDVERPVEPPV